MIVATCASLASREKLLREAVASLLPQVDAICLYLNGYQKVPASLRHPKVLYAVLSSDAGYRGPEGKFWFWDSDEFKAAPAPWSPETIGLTFDDDIIYPPDYVKRMTEALERHPLACVHGSILTSPFESWKRSRRCIHFAEPLENDTQVHVPGTGTLAFRVKDFHFSIRRDYEWSKVCDPAVGIYAKRNGLGIFAVARDRNWLIPQMSSGYSIARERIMAGIDEAETRMISLASPWSELPLPPELERKTPAQVNVGPVHFALIVPGWRCAEYVRSCWESIATQLPGPYTWEAHFFDDGSGDGTWDAVASLPDDSRLFRLRGEDNLGGALARWQMIQGIEDPQTVCVLLDMDDQLERGALTRVAHEYQKHPGTWLTYGSWTADRPEGKAQERTQRPYPTRVMTERAYRKHAFVAGPLRTFRRHLVDGIPERYMQDTLGKWLMCCTDVALMWPLMEQCSPENIRYIKTPLYRYSWRRPMGTLDRFGIEEKRALREHLSSLPRLPPKSLDAPSLSVIPGEAVG